MTMQLPRTIRQWFTPEQACQYLSQAFECEVVLSDLQDYQGKSLRQFWRTNNLFPHFFLYKDLIRAHEEHFSEMPTKMFFKLFPGLFEGSPSDEDKTRFMICMEKGVHVIHGWIIDENERVNALVAVDNAFICVLPEVEYHHEPIFFKLEESNCIIDGKRICKTIDTNKCGEVGYTKDELDEFILNYPNSTKKAQINYAALVVENHKPYNPNKKRHPAKAQPSFLLKKLVSKSSELPFESQNDQTETHETKRPTPVSKQHRANLLQKITSNNLDPLQLAGGKSGKAGDKAKLREWLVPNTMTPSQFKTTWENAMADKVIQYKK
jgi:hypothetical protein